MTCDAKDSSHSSVPDGRQGTLRLISHWVIKIILKKRGSPWKESRVAAIAVKEIIATWLELSKFTSSLPKTIRHIGD